MDKQKISTLYNEVIKRIENVHIGCFLGSDRPLFLISDTYPGVWLEHVYDSIMYAKLDKKGIEIAKNTLDLFIDNQKPDGQYPCYVWNGAKINKPENVIGYSQLQECVSFPKLCLMLYKLSPDEQLLKKIYNSGKKWVWWLCNNRMTTNRGLVEMFYGYDTGHDNSGRLKGMSCRGNYRRGDELMNASVLPPEDGITPILAVDMNASFYASNMALAEMAELLGKSDEAIEWKEKAAKVKELMFRYCYDEKDAFFYDVDKNGNKRKYLSSTIFHLFLEGVLDKEKDAAIIKEIYEKHIKNPNEFWTQYPLPSMAVCDPSVKNHSEKNCWGYYSQGLIALRCTMWMDEYGWSEDFDELCEKWVKAWTKHYDKCKFGQELDPHTGVPTDCSQWYSSCMLFYVYAVRRLKILD